MRYGNNASNGKVLELGNGSEIQSEIEVIKPSNYSIAVRAESCEICTYLNISITGYANKNGIRDDHNTYKDSISLKGENSGLDWISSTNTYYLSKGTYYVRIHSDSKTDLDTVLVYEDNNTRSGTTKDSSEDIRDLFTVSSPAAKLTGFHKIDPTKYVLNIENATRPYTISLAEAYDPLWTVYIENSDGKSNFQINSHPLYGIVNGFNINKTGSYSLVLEYQPQNWFVQGATISAVTALLLVFITIIYYRRRRLDKLRH